MQNNLANTLETRIDRMDTLHLSTSVSLPVHYELDLVYDIFAPDNPKLYDALASESRGQQQIIVLDSVLQDLAPTIYRYCNSWGISVQLLILSTGEGNKILENVLTIVDFLNLHHQSRVSNPPIGVGGNVLTDVLGFACSMYRRGIPWIRIPTTLLGVVDGSVSAKTGVNYQGHRNRLGAFHPAIRTFIDPHLLTSLPVRQIINACGEILKIAVIKDYSLFTLLEKHARDIISKNFDCPAVQAIIEKAIVGMHDELKINLWEHDLQRIVNYGHIFSPQVEMGYIPELLHGEAVGIDCLFSAIIAEQRGLLSTASTDRIARLMNNLCLPTYHRGFSDMSKMCEALREAVRHHNGKLNAPILTGIGECNFTQQIFEHELEYAASRLYDYGQMQSQLVMQGHISHPPTLVFPSA